jgi:hypothetical protein
MTQAPGSSIIELNQVGQDGGILHRRAGIGPKEAAAVGAQVLDDFKCCHGAGGQHLKSSLQGLHDDVFGEGLRHALPDQKQAAHQGKGQEHPGGDPNQIGKEVTNVVLCFPGHAPDKGYTSGVAAGSGDKHHKGDDQHLAQVAQAGLTRVVLKVRICHETDDGVEGQRRLHASNMVGVEDPNALDTQDQVANGDHHGVGADQCQCVLPPVHASVWVNADDFVDHVVDPVQYRVGEGVLPGGDVIKIAPYRNDKDQIKDPCQDQL